jgi:hypothetical protein
VLIHQGPSVTQENYEATVGAHRRQEPPGLTVRLACRGSSGARSRAEPQGFRVVDVWRSEEACNRFGEILQPILQEVGIDDPPELYPAEVFVSA